VQRHQGVKHHNREYSTLRDLYNEPTVKFNIDMPLPEINPVTNEPFTEHEAQLLCLASLDPVSP